MPEPSKRGRPTVPKPKVVPVNASPVLQGYLDDLVQLEIYGTSRAEVARNFVLKEVARLVENGTLTKR